jgi:hypothetical protein
MITKGCVDTAVNSIDLSNYATKNELTDLSDYSTKNELPDLSSCITKSDMYYEGDPTKDIRIKYNSTPVDT